MAGISDRKACLNVLLYYEDSSSENYWRPVGDPGAIRTRDLSLHTTIAFATDQQRRLWSGLSLHHGLLGPLGATLLVSARSRFLCTWLRSGLPSAPVADPLRFP